MKYTLELKRVEDRASEGAKMSETQDRASKL